ncbi:hypothetical protein SEVIR_4G189003v4 [Setaria viridis]
MGNKSSGVSSVDTIQDDFNLLWGTAEVFGTAWNLSSFSVTYNSVLTPPGGFWTKDEHGHKAADPTLHVEFSQRHEFTVIVDLFSLMGAYAAGSWRALKSSIYIWILVFAIFIYVRICRYFILSPYQAVS